MMIGLKKQLKDYLMMNVYQEFIKVKQQVFVHLDMKTNLEEQTLVYFL